MSEVPSQSGRFDAALFGRPASVVQIKDEAAIACRLAAGLAGNVQARAQRASGWSKRRTLFPLPTQGDAS